MLQCIGQSLVRAIAGARVGLLWDEPLSPASRLARMSGGGTARVSTSDEEADFQSEGRACDVVMKR